MTAKIDKFWQTWSRSHEKARKRHYSPLPGTSIFQGFWFYYLLTLPNTPLYVQFHIWEMEGFQSLIGKEVEVRITRLRKGRMAQGSGVSGSHLRIDIPAPLELPGEVSAFSFRILASPFSTPSQQLEIQPRPCYRCWDFTVNESRRSTFQVDTGHWTGECVRELWSGLWTEASQEFW